MKTSCLQSFKLCRQVLKTVNNSQKLIIVDLIPSFRKNDFSWKKYYQMPLAQIGFSDNSIEVCSKS